MWMLVSRRMFEWCFVREGNDLRNTNSPPCETENHLQKKPVFNTMLVTDKGFFLNMMIFLFSGHCIHSLEDIVVNNFVCNTHTLCMGKLPRPKSGGMSYYLSRPHCDMLILTRKMRFRAVEHSSNKKHLKWNQMESRGINGDQFVSIGKNWLEYIRISFLKWQEKRQNLAINMERGIVAWLLCQKLGASRWGARGEWREWTCVGVPLSLCMRKVQHEVKANRDGRSATEILWI